MTSPSTPSPSPVPGGGGDSYRVDLTLTCDDCRTVLEIHDQPGPGPLRAYLDFVQEHTHAPAEETR